MTEPDILQILKELSLLGCASKNCVNLTLPYIVASSDTDNSSLHSNPAIYYISLMNNKGRHKMEAPATGLISDQQQ